jgi:hypothetical protein
VFIVSLVLSGVTAIPLETELNFLTPIAVGASDTDHTVSIRWIIKVRDALADTNNKYPFLTYGTDWLAFAHFVIAIAFIGPIRNPIKNIWVIEFGMIACALIVPFALVMGSIRGIPIGWRLIDCSFGLFGIIPLWCCRRLITRLTGARALCYSKQTV